MTKYLVARTFLMWLTIVALGATAHATIPLEHFFKNAEFTNVRLSPDGSHIGALTRVAAAPKARNLVVMHIDSKKATVVTGYDTEDVTQFAWANNNRLVFTLAEGLDESARYGRYLGTYSVDREGRNGVELHNPYEGDSRSASKVGKSSAKGGVLGTIRLVDQLKGLKDEVLVLVTDRRYIFPEPYRLNVRTGRLDRLAVNDSNVEDWFATRDGRVVLAVDNGALDDSKLHLMYRPDENTEWREIYTYERDQLDVLSVSADGASAFVASRHESDRLQLYQLDLATANFGEALVSDPIYDIYSTAGGELINNADGVPAMYTYMADLPKKVFFDRDWHQRQASLDAALPDTENSIVGWSKKSGRALVRAWSDREPGVYYLFDEKKASLKKLVALAGWLDSAEMADVKPITFEARDGETVRGYLTMPRDADGKPVPLIVHPHGGPYGIRDAWEFNPDVQFLASRGYAVLQVDYRGSGGYGARFERMAHKQWGLQMQDDLTDAVQWAVEQGYADKDRLAIYGASYGGYATMAGVTKTPDLFKCGINYVGVVDLPMQIRHWRNRYNVTGADDAVDGFIDMAIGDGPEDQQRLHDTSPINHVDKIKVPLLVIHGRVDNRVNIDQYQKLVRALKAHDKPFESIMKRHEGHGFYKEQNSIELYQTIEEFLAKNL